MDDSSGSQPDGDEDGDELGQPDGGRRLQDVQVLKDIRNCHQTEGSEKSQAWNMTKAFFEDHTLKLAQTYDEANTHFFLSTTFKEPPDQTKLTESGSIRSLHLRGRNSSEYCRHKKLSLALFQRHTEAQIQRNIAEGAYGVA